MGSDKKPKRRKASMAKKPEHMTSLIGSTLVPKNHPRIILRGKLDSLQAQVVLIQCELTDKALVKNLQDILNCLRELTRCEVLDQPFEQDTLFGQSYADLQKQSHNPQKYFGVAVLHLPDHKFGRDYALLNTLRTAIRETELIAVEAFKTESGLSRGDIVLALNRLSSAVYVLMCQMIAE